MHFLSRPMIVESQQNKEIKRDLKNPKQQRSYAKGISKRKVKEVPG